MAENYEIPKKIFYYETFISEQNELEQNGSQTCDIKLIIVFP